MVQQGFKGFTLIESLIVILILSMFCLLSVPIQRKMSIYTKSDQLIEEISFEQIEAIKENNYHNYENEEFSLSITFTRLASVLHAETIHLDKYDIIVSLGTGRIYEKP